MTKENYKKLLEKLNSDFTGFPVGKATTELCFELDSKVLSEVKVSSENEKEFFTVTILNKIVLSSDHVENKALLLMHKHGHSTYEQINAKKLDDMIAVIENPQTVQDLTTLKNNYNELVLEKQKQTLLTKIAAQRVSGNNVNLTSTTELEDVPEVQVKGNFSLK
jgi:hypothetical protein